jgi:hypothetical protein
MLHEGVLLDLLLCLVVAACYLGLFSFRLPVFLARHAERACGPPSQCKFENSFNKNQAPLEAAHAPLRRPEAPPPDALQAYFCW